MENGISKKIAGFFAASLFLFSNKGLSETKIYKINIIKTIENPNTLRKNIIYYKIKPGDTIYGILKKYKLPIKMLDEIVKLNKLKDPDKIKWGQTLKVPLPQSKFSGGKRGKVKVKKKFIPDISPILKKYGKIYKKGTILLNSRAINLSKNPLITFKGKNYILNLNGNIPEDIVKELESLGYKVLSNKKDIKNVMEDYLLSDYGYFEENGILKLGNMDKIKYRYDYLTYDTETGNIKIFNTEPDTPKELKNILSAYGITVEQPKRQFDSGHRGILKILTGNPEKKVAKLLLSITNERPVKVDKEFLFKKIKIFITPENFNPEEKTKKKMEGFTVISVSNENIETAIKKAVESVPYVMQKIKLVIVEPPGTEGKRSKFEIIGYSIDTPIKRYFLIPGVEKPEEISYLLSRGVNLIIY